jgi:hypothetical protein
MTTHILTLLTHRFSICLTSLLMSMQIIQAALDSGLSTPSMKVYQTGTEKLVVYTDVPGHQTKFHNVDPCAKSPIYEIRVRSQATDMEWVQCFAHHTYNRAEELPKMNATQGNTNPVVSQGYQRHTGGWTQAYVNIEMTDDSAVEVEISKIGDALLDGLDVIQKSSVHPSHKVSHKNIRDGKVYFTLKKTCQLVIDPNGQMDDHNAAFPEHKQKGSVHSVTFFANPIMEKPPAIGSGICYVRAGEKIAKDSVDYDTMVFSPGVHYIGAFELHAGKKYFIPGDAILYGNLNCGNANDVTVYGYGTLSGFYVPHYQYKATSQMPNPSYPADAEGSQGLHFRNSKNVTIHGITIVDPATFAAFIIAGKGGVGRSKILWTKAITWRTNGDGFGGDLAVEDCFLRTGDDTTILNGNRLRCTLWKDTNARMVRLKNWKDGTTVRMEDCDIIYNRLRIQNGTNGKVFIISNTGPKDRVVRVNVTIKDVRFHDKLSNMAIFDLDSTGGEAGVSYTGLTFENISCYLPVNPAIRNKLMGTEKTPWNDSPVFKNVTFDHQDGGPPVTLTKENFKKYFDTNAYANPKFLP